MLVGEAGVDFLRPYAETRLAVQRKGAVRVGLGYGGVWRIAIENKEEGRGKGSGHFPSTYGAEVRMMSWTFW